MDHIDKNIPSLIDENGKETLDSPLFLKLQANFFKGIIPLKDSRYYNLINNLPQISDADKTRSHSPYTINELESAIKIKSQVATRMLMNSLTDLWRN